MIDCWYAEVLMKGSERADYSLRSKFPVYFSDDVYIGEDESFEICVECKMRIAEFGMIRRE